MQKVLIGIGMLCVFGMTACSSDSNKDDPIYTDPDTPVAEDPYIRVVFNPATADINIPNDLLMAPNEGDTFFDFTLNTEGSAEFDLTNPQHTLTALDGWSLHQPMAIRVENPEGMDIDPASVNGDSIKLYESTQALLGTSDACQEIAGVFQTPGVPCELGDQLVYGEDFALSYLPGSGVITVIPLKVLKPAQGYLLVVTESLKDLTGRPVKGSGTWDLVRQDITTNQVGVEALVPLQKIVNYMVDVLEPAGINRGEISYAAYFSTQSTQDVLDASKKLLIAPYAKAMQTMLGQGADLVTAQATASLFLPSIQTENTDVITPAFELISAELFSQEQLAGLEAVGLDTCSGLISAVSDSSSPLFDTAASAFAVAGGFCAASTVNGTADLPYYLDPAAPKTGRWQAACTSGATLKLLGAEVVGGLLQGMQTGAMNDLCQEGSDGLLYDFDLSSLGMQDPRYLTQFNPIPLAQGRQIDDPETAFNEQGTESLRVFMTVPNVEVAAMVSALSNGSIPAIQKPESGWPVVIFSHGIAGNKEDVLALSATLSLAGFATISVDHPLHGDRSMMGEDGALVQISAATISDFLNFASLLTARDNPRQSSTDIMGLRLALNQVNDESELFDIDSSKVHFVAHSLGAITGAVAVATANSTLGGEMAAFDDMFAFTSSVLNVPAGGIPSFLLQSADFGPLIKGSLLAETSTDFATFVTNYATENQLMFEAAVRPAYEIFMATLADAEKAVIEANFAQFGFAAQTVLDAADPISYAHSLGENTPTLVQLIVGGGTNDDGSTALTDQVNPVTTSLPLVGGQPLADLMGLEKISSSTESSGVVRFLTGNHFSLFLPTASAEATAEMHSQMTSFFASEGSQVVVTNIAVVEN